MSKSIGIFYFSGTGNAEIVANLVGDALKSKGSMIDVLKIEEVLKKNIQIAPETYGMIGLGYTIHAWNAPRLVFDFIKALPAVKHKKVFLFKCSGDPFLRGGATTMIRGRLRKKGYEVFHEKLIVMPANVFIRFHERMEKQLYQTAQRRAATMAEDILSEKVKLQENPLFARIWTQVFSSGESFGASFFGKSLRISQACTLCQICVKHCPTNNIFKEGQRITFGGKCVFCMRCIYKCPESAISPGFPFRVFALKGGYNIQPIINDPNIPGDYLSSKTPWMWKRFYNYTCEE